MRIILSGDKKVAGGYLGWAKSRLSLLKSGMKLLDLRQSWAKYALKGANVSVSSSFGLDQIRIFARGKEVPLIFLIRSDGEYAVFMIGKDDALTTCVFEIPTYTTYFAIFENRNPSVVKSDEGYQNHVYTVENVSVDNKYFQPGYDYGYPQYGRRIQSYNLLPDDKLVAIGVRNCFINDVFDYNTSYLNYPLGQTSQYICSGRHSSYVVQDEGLIENLRVWRDVSNEGQIKYVVSGEEKNGAIIPFLYQHDIYAVISPTLIVGIPDDEQIYVPDTFTQNPCGDGTYDYTYVYGYQRPAGWCFGNVQLEEAWKNYAYAHNDCWSVSECQWPGVFLWRRSMYSVNGTRTIRWYDYDNIDGDNTFICFYGIHESGYESTCGQVKQTYWGPLWESGRACTGKILKYRMAYRINGGETIKSEITDIVAGIWTTWGSGSCESQPAKTGQGNGTDGQRVSSISCKISDDYILYTYILKDFTGSGTDGLNHIDDMDDTNYTFNKRVLGTINIKTGIHIQNELTDVFLGKYKDTFDKTQAAAIGFHKRTT